MRADQITLRQLRYLTAIAQTAHFRRAAEQCGVSQPSLSAQIQSLEDTLGIHLVERGRSGVSLTPVGREVVSRARNVLEDVRAIADLASQARDDLIGTIRLGAKPTLGPYLLPHVASALRSRHRDLKLYIREAPPRDLERELSEGMHDIILSQLPLVGSEFIARPLFREPLYLAMDTDHPLARKDRIRSGDLKGLEMLSLSPSYHLHAQINDLCREHGARMNREYEGTSLDALRQMVGMGMGVTILPALYVNSELKPGAEVIVRRFSFGAPYRSISLVWRKSAGRAPAYEQIAETMREVATGLIDAMAAREDGALIT
ncbi:MAG: hydrogen peroxide-inducible genes activator [Pseudomonadota bacterium]